MGVTTSTANAGATYEPIATQTLGSAAATVDFTSIPATYTDLILVCNPTSSGGTDNFSLVFNSDTGNNYSYTGISGNGTSAASFRETNKDTAILGSVTSGNNAHIVHIMKYFNTTIYKTAISRANTPANWVQSNVATWRSTAAINAISVRIGASGSPTLAAGGIFTLYGIRAA